MGDRILIESYDPAWPAQFASIATRLREALGERALRIDHIGSTAVPGLSAKPVIDIQISVGELEPVAHYAEGLGRAGFRWRADNRDRTKRYFREGPAMARTHIHVRTAGSWSEQLSLLFRDYLRDDQPSRERYAQAKRELAARFRDDREGYVAAKAPIVWMLLQRADVWSQATGWAPGPSDA